MTHTIETTTTTMELKCRPISELRSKFWMVQKIGNGSFGKVYLVRHRKTTKLSVAKHQKCSGDLSLRHHQREAKILRMLRGHENVLAIQDYFEGPGESVILTEYVESKELFQIISSRKFQLTEAKCRDFFWQMLNGIEFVHSKRIIHLDLKPENILLVTRPRQNSPNGQVKPSKNGFAAHQPGLLKIIDFGLARQLEPHSDRIPINLGGTMEFISPEVMRCSHASTASDMWSIGVILFMMLSGGHSPFWDGTMIKTKRRVLSGIYNLNQESFRNVTVAAQNCIRQLLVKDDRLRLSARLCLKQSWLMTDSSNLEKLQNLETKWMRKSLARKRWQKWFNLVRAMNRMQRMGQEGSMARKGSMSMIKEEADVIKGLEATRL